MVSYELCKEKLKKLVTRLPSTEIKFLFYSASDLSKPKLRTQFHRWDIDKNTFYIIHGNEDAFVYVYKESDLKVLVKTIDIQPGSFKTGPAPLRNAFKSFTDVEIIDHKQGDVNIGNHIDFGIHRQRNGNVLIKSHSTSYSDIENARVTRNEDHCNFVIRNQNFYDANEFNRIACESKLGEPTGATVESIYTEQHEKYVLFHLCDAIIFDKSGGANLYHRYKGRSYKVRHGKKGGMFIILSNKHNVYIQKQKMIGGAFSPTYKGISFMTDTFIQFISDKFLSRIGNLRSDLLSVKVIFDETNVIYANGNKNIVIIYNFEHDISNIFYLDTIILLTACYSNEQILLNPQVQLQANEKACYEAMERMTTRMVNEVISVA